jgi:hypothetical protein
MRTELLYEIARYKLDNYTWVLTERAQVFSRDGSLWRRVNDGPETLCAYTDVAAVIAADPVLNEIRDHESARIKAKPAVLRHLPFVLRIPAHEENSGRHFTWLVFGFTVGYAVTSSGRRIVVRSVVRPQPDVKVIARVFLDIARWRWRKRGRTVLPPRLAWPCVSRSLMPTFVSALPMVVGLRPSCLPMAAREWPSA